MSLRRTLQRISSRRGSVAALVAAALAACGFVAWRTGQASPSDRHTQAGIQLMLEKKPAEAEREWLEATRLDPNSAQPWQLLGDYYKAAERWPKAARAFGQVLKANPDAAEVHADLALCALKVGDTNAARLQAEKALQRNANDATALRVLAEAADRTENDAERAKYLRRLCDLAPRDAELLGDLADTLILTADYAEAREVADRMLTLEPNSSRALVARGTSRFYEDPSESGLALARADFEKALKLSPGEVEAHRFLARICLRSGQTQEAIAHFEAVGRGRPYAMAHFVELAGAYRKAGDQRKADALARRFSEAERFNTRMRYLRDRSQLKSQKFEDNLELGLLLLASVEENRDSYHLFEYRYREDTIESVNFYLSRALALRPGDVRAQAAMRRLEDVYTRHLQAGQQALQQRDLGAAAHNFGRLVLLRPLDPRTLSATRQIAP